MNKEMQYVIREAIPDDAESLIAFLNQVGGETDYLTFGKEGLPISEERERKFISSVQQDAHSLMLVACDKQGKIIANASLSGNPRRMSHWVDLGITVEKKAWGHGVGSALMEHLIVWAKGHGIELIHLEVRSDNLTAVHLYEKYGFRKVGIVPAYFKIDEKYYDFLMMVLDLRG